MKRKGPMKGRAISKDIILKLRLKTGAGIMDCKEALEEAGCDLEKAIELLRKRGLALAVEKSKREAREGRVASYIHPDGRVGALVEVNCETDFVAKNEIFMEFAKDLTMQIAAQSPLYISREEVPRELIERRNLEDLDKFYREVCLMEQPFIKNPDITIKDYLASVIAKTGENIVIRRFVRYELGGEAKSR